MAFHYTGYMRLMFSLILLYRGSSKMLSYIFLSLSFVFLLMGSSSKKNYVQLWVMAQILIAYTVSH
jgi:hypothetical protein